MNNKLPELVTMGDPQLAKPARPVHVKHIGRNKFQQKIDTLIECMFHYQGIGIAGPQIGWFERVFVLQNESELEVWINPEIVWSSSDKAWAWEGCLSVPGLMGWIERPQDISVRGLNRHGEPCSAELVEWSARVYQHEYDHLDGLLYPYRAKDARHIVCAQAFESRSEWPTDWPAKGAAKTPTGELYL